MLVDSQFGGFLLRILHLNSIDPIVWLGLASLSFMTCIVIGLESLCSLSLQTFFTAIPMQLTLRLDQHDETERSEPSIT
uniref:Uncharacterized protein n=1 Tax=Utricularia reniformis TaxID=192314 RepID=A0A1Y0AZZ6_9LAMI|nr:hypothetical protein AEK19_MT0450 [Utricularia reniformis]ART30713.1 hypothetical protein AEK19_MT0450 [Utricularia reniformis]